jgi:hypothetical protein
MYSKKCLFILTLNLFISKYSSIFKKIDQRSNFGFFLFFYLIIKCMQSKDYDII